MDKPALAVLIAEKIKKDKSSKSEDVNKYKDMAQEILDAIETKDASSLGKALKAFVSVCGSDYEEDEE